MKTELPSRSTLVLFLMPRQQTTWPGSCLHDQSGLIKVARYQNHQRLNHEMRGTAGVFLPPSAPLNPKPPLPSSPGQKGSFRGKGVEPYLFSGPPEHISCCNAPHDREEQLVRLREATRSRRTRQGREPLPRISLTCRLL